ncbi:hypothetical protein ACVXZZ_04080 [Staphylococcus aureus]
MDNQKQNPNIWSKNTFVGRAGQPVELCGTYVCDYATEESSYTTGQVFGVSGGVQID